MAGVQNTIQLNDRMTPVLRSIVKALDSTLRAMAEVDKISSKSFGKATEAVQRANRALQDLGSGASESGRKLRDSAKQGSTALDDLIGKAKTLLATYVALQGSQLLVARSDAFVGTKASLDLMIKMTESQKTSAQLQQEIYEASQRSLSNYRDMAKTVAKLGLLAGEAFGSTDEMVQFTELLNKQFSLVKATPWEKSAAMYQLTQAMASGRLQGDEFRSIIENAPMLAQTIQEYMGLTGQAFKEASRDGKITADVIKNALFSVAQETNEAFAKMPLNFGELWIQVLNKLDKGLEPVYEELGRLWNNKDFQHFLDLAVNGLVGLSRIALKVMKAIGGIATWLYDRWRVVVPLIVGATAIFATFLAMQAIGWAKVAGLMLWKIALDWAETGALIATTAAQKGLNAAMAVCPLSWIIYGLILLVAAIYMVVGAINTATGETYSATGVIVGSLNVLVAVVWNILLALLEIVWAVIQNMYNGWASFVNFLSNMWTAPITTGIKLWQHFGNSILNIIGAIASAIDAVFGSDLSKHVNKWHDGLNNRANKAIEKHAKDENYEEKLPLFHKNLTDLGLSRAYYGEIWDTGYDIGKAGMGSIEDMFTIGDKMFDSTGGGIPGWSSMEELAKNAEGINANTGDTAKTLREGVNLSSEDVNLLKEHARMQFVNKLTSLTPKVNATFGDVRESADVNVILQLIEKLVKEASESDLTNGD